MATVTEIAHYLRLLYAKVGDVHCPECDTLVAPAHADEIYARIRDANARGHVTLFAPAVRARKGTYLDVFTMASRAGLTHARVDGDIVAIEPPPRLAKTKEHTDRSPRLRGPRAGARPVDVRPRARPGPRGHPAPGGGGETPGRRGGRDHALDGPRLPACGIGVPELDPRWFSFNTRQGQ